jgi:hypothetical protein
VSSSCLVVSLVCLSQSQGFMTGSDLLLKVRKLDLSYQSGYILPVWCHLMTNALTDKCLLLIESA